MKENSRFLPVNAEEIKLLGWDRPDIIIVTGDAYIDHPAFGAAVIGRLGEYLGMRVAILPQPNWRDDLRDFKKLGRPAYFFGVTAGAMDSMVNHYTARRRLRRDDAYTPGGRHGYRPDLPSIIYTRILKELYPETPVILGGVEASMRRFTHYDYWQDRLRPSILAESGADMLIYGMAEQAFARIIELLSRGVPFNSLHNILQTAFITDAAVSLPPIKGYGEQELPAHEECVSDKRKFAEAFRITEQASNAWKPDRLVQRHKNMKVVVNPPYPLADTKTADLPYDLPYTRLPHPKYNKKPPVPAWEMIRYSVNIHRGCFGGCSFCAISAHQGRFVVSRSESSVLKEVEKIVAMPGFRGHITDLGGPTANMYKMGGTDKEICRKCRRPSCLYPSLCTNLDFDHNPLLSVYKKALQVRGVKKITIGSGIRHDMLTGRTEKENKAYGLDEYTNVLLRNHVSGRLKLAPEHTEANVLRAMRKPSFKSFELFLEKFRAYCKQHGLPWQVVPYFISGHPACTEKDMQNLGKKAVNLGLIPDKVQEFTPTPMTLSTTMYYTGIDPYTGRRVFSARGDDQKKRQKSYLFKTSGKTRK